ncbi:MAG: hypothetical protein CL681_05140 [Blastopirellula sp.]|nr:hypothetical protein [Blastopirellula sp.]
MDTGAIDRRECFDNVNRIPLPGSGCIQNQAWLSDVLSERLEEWVGWSNGTRLVVWGCALHSGRFFLFLAWVDVVFWWDGLLESAAGFDGAGSGARKKKTLRQNLRVFCI